MMTLPSDFEWVKEMYDDAYYPDFLVDKVKEALVPVAAFIGEGGHSLEEIQGSLDEAIGRINGLQDEFWDNDSDIETVARESIGATVEAMLAALGVDIDTETAIRERDW